MAVFPALTSKTYLLNFFSDSWKVLVLQVFYYKFFVLKSQDYFIKQQNLLKYYFSNNLKKFFVTWR